jgi:hypothetical protein
MLHCHVAADPDAASKCLWVLQLRWNYVFYEAFVQFFNKMIWIKFCTKLLNPPDAI